jgi:hypothetical protein
MPRGAERDVRPPLALRRNSPDSPDDSAAGDKEAQVFALRRDELLHERSVAFEPPSMCDRGEVTPERRSVLAERDVPTQLPKRGLTTTGGSNGTTDDGAVM